MEKVTLTNGGIETSVCDMEMIQKLAEKTKLDALRKDVKEVRLVKDIKRNDPCPCGSGKKFKHCCLLTARQ